MSLKLPPHERHGPVEICRCFGPAKTYIIYKSRADKYEEFTTIGAAYDWCLEQNYISKAEYLKAKITEV